MIDRVAEPTLIAYVVYYALLATLFWAPATVISWALEDLWRMITFAPDKEIS